MKTQRADKIKTIKDHLRLNRIQLAKSRSFRNKMIFADSISAAIYLKTLSQAENAFTLLELVIDKSNDEMIDTVFEVLITKVPERTKPLSGKEIGTA